jgi:hypothetical protein
LIKYESFAASAPRSLAPMDILKDPLSIIIRFLDVKSIGSLGATCKYIHNILIRPLQELRLKTLCWKHWKNAIGIHDGKIFRYRIYDYCDSCNKIFRLFFSTEYLDNMDFLNSRFHWKCFRCHVNNFAGFVRDKKKWPQDGEDVDAMLNYKEKINIKGKIIPIIYSIRSSYLST